MGPVQFVAQNLSVERAGRTIVSGLSFTVPAGRVLVLTGSNGAGKTTLLRCLAGLLPAAAGTVALEGGDTERTAGEQAHFIGHLNGVKATLTVAENLGFWTGFLAGDAATPSARQGTVAAALDAFDLAHLSHIPAGYLSAGQKRRLGLARLLTAPRPLWLLDEPTVSLDTRSAGLLAAAVDRHTAAGGIAIAATHLDLGLQRASELRLGAKPRSEAA